MRTGDDERMVSTGYRRTFITMSFLVATFNFADRSVFAVTAQQIKVDLQLTDFQNLKCSASGTKSLEN